MKVLFVRRSPVGGMARLAETLAAALQDFDIEVVVEDAESWIPTQTGWMIDRRVKKVFRDKAAGFDMVHAFGYRSAWAAAESFGVRFPWVYTAYDMPKTRHPHLADRLNHARRGICSSRGVFEQLVKADVHHLEALSPCLPERGIPNREEARRLLEIQADEFLVLAAGRMVPERGLESFAASVREAKDRVPEIVGAVGVLGEPTFDLSGLRRIKEDLHLWVEAADLVVVPSERAGFSMFGAEAMAAQIPVLMRRISGLDEMASDGYSAFYYDRPEDLAGKICQIYDLPMARESVARAGQIRVEDRCNDREAARILAHTYQDILTP